MIRTCRGYGLAADRKEKRTGAWIGDGKVGAIGVRVARWVTSHGLALNIDTDLSAFRHIVPCGLADSRVTSVSRELGRTVALDDAMDRLTTHMLEVFERTAAA
jgi:lipoyl(octanoyl) transferase